MSKISSNFNRLDFLSDVRSGFLVFLIALPLCLGIAIASGFPAIAGIMTAIVGGIVVSCIGGSSLTVKGPAAGMIVIVAGAVTELGNGDMIVGYHQALAVGMVAAVIQMLFSFFRLANLGISISRSVVHGMLAAIGVIIISKQIHVALGVKPDAKSIVDLILAIPHSIMNMNPEIAMIGIGSFIFLMIWAKMQSKIAKAIPAQIIILMAVIALSLYLHISQDHDYTFMSHEYHLGANYLVQLPGSLFGAITFPDFSAITSAVSIKYIAMFALVGTIESTLTVVAIDNIDPKKRKTNLNMDLFALACGNLISSGLGGLPMISEIVRSKANVDNGATSRRANFFHGVFLLLFVALLPKLLSLIPLAALAAMLVYVGFRLASPTEFSHAKAVGIDQFILFLTTLLMIIFTDLLIGVACGLILKIILHMLRGASLKDLFAGKIDVVKKNHETRFVMHGAAAFPNLLHLKKKIDAISDDVKKVVIDVSEAKLVDHTFLSGVKNITASKHGIDFSVVGLEKFKTMSSHPEATRWN